MFYIWDGQQSSKQAAHKNKTVQMMKNQQFIQQLTPQKSEDFLLVSTPRTAAATGTCTGRAALDRQLCVPSFEEITWPKYTKMSLEEGGHRSYLNGEPL